VVTKVLINPLRAAAELSAVDGDPLGFHRRLPGYGPTPLIEAPSLAADLGMGALWVKDESSRLGLPAFKILGASWATYRALVDRLGFEPDRWTDVTSLAQRLAGLRPLTLVAATDGNHGRAVARTAALLDFASVILVPAGTAAARIDAIAGEGAEVRVVDGTYDEAVAESAALAGERAVVVSDTSWPGYTDTPRRVIDGYSTILAEVDQQLAARAAPSPDVYVVQMGVGALAAAVVTHARRSSNGGVGGKQPLVVVVEPETADCGLRSAEAGEPVVVPGPHTSIMAGLNCGTVSPIAWPVLAAGVDVFVAVEDAAAERAMRDLDAVGIEAGETGGAGLAGLRALCEQGGIVPDGARVLVISTEGATDPVAYQRIVGHPPLRVGQASSGRTTGGSVDQGKLIQRSVRRQT
jgi:diaminopropionate ammonia-lyase